jgi:hypothetical protein
MARAMHVERRSRQVANLPHEYVARVRPLEGRWSSVAQRALPVAVAVESAREPKCWHLSGFSVLGIAGSNKILKISVSKFHSVDFCLLAINPIRSILVALG